MKAITVWQPWASLIAIGAKPYEFRKWAAPKACVGQRIAIHAGARAVKPTEVRALIIGLRSKSAERHGLKVEPALDLLERLLLSRQVLPLSHVVCTVRLGQPRRADLLASELGIDLANDSDRSAAFNFAWPMLAVEPLMPPVPARGAQGFWEIAL